MDRAPLPPHERTWRHPSELAAESSAALGAEQVSHGSRILALIGGATGVLVIGVLVMTMTPGPGNGPEAMSSTTVLSGGVNVGLARAALNPPRPLAMVGEAAGAPAQPRAVPVGDDGLALSSTSTVREVLRRGAMTASDEILVSLDTGFTVPAAVLDLGAPDGIAVLVIVGPVRGNGLDVAESMPAEDDVVTLLSEPPQRVELGELEGQVLAVDDTTAVVDDDGALVGLCVRQLAGPGDADDAVRFIGLGELPGDANEPPG